MIRRLCGISVKILLNIVDGYKGLIYIYTALKFCSGWRGIYLFGVSLGCVNVASGSLYMSSSSSSSLSLSLFALI